MAPMGNCQMAEETGRPNDKMREYFLPAPKARVGLLTTGLIPISHHIDSSVTEKGNFSYFPASTTPAPTSWAGAIWRRASTRATAAFSSSSPPVSAVSATRSAL